VVRLVACRGKSRVMVRCGLARCFVAHVRNGDWGVMVDTRLKFFVLGGADVVDAALSKSDGGTKLERGVRELVAAGFSGVEVEVAYEAVSGFAALRRALESGTSRLIDERPEIVLLSVADDVRGFGGSGVTTGEALRDVRADLVAVIGLVKEKVGAHIFVANASTLDPSQEVFNYRDVVEEPMSLRVQRFDLMLVGVSHDEGVSIIDIDRKIAELGGVRGVTAVLDYSEAGCQTVAVEIVRVMEDYGFFDDRALLAQVGARAGTK